MTELLLDENEIDEAKGREALPRFRLDEVAFDDAELFERAYGALDAEFGAKGELERLEVVRAWLASREGYHLVVASSRATPGKLVAVRDCHVRLDRAARAAVAYLAHVVVEPEHRRSGLAALMRAVPWALAERALAAAKLEGDVLLAAEMEPVELAEPDTVLRLVAYGRAGFAAISPACLPYCQPDFRDLALLGVPARPLPMLAVVRVRGMGSRLPKRLAEAYVRNLYAVFGTHCRASDMKVPMAHALAALEACPGDDVPLLALPTSVDDRAALVPLLRENVLPYHSSLVRSESP